MSSGSEEHSPFGCSPVQDRGRNWSFPALSFCHIRGTPPITVAGVPLGTPHDRDSPAANSPC